LRISVELLSPLANFGRAAFASYADIYGACDFLRRSKGVVLFSSRWASFLLF
jgi:hypothetical protein